MALNVSALTAYLDEQREPLIGKAVTASKTAKMLNLQTGVKGKAALNLLTTTTEFGDGEACGWNEAGSSVLSQREIVTGGIKINKSFCDKTLMKYWMGHQVKVAAGAKTLPFEEDFVNQEIDAIASALENAIWKGDTDSITANLNKFDGLIKLIDAAMASTNHALNVGVTALTTSNVMTIVDNVYNAIPAALLGNPNVVVFCGSDTFRKYVLALRAANLFHHEAAIGDLELLIPATNTKLVAVHGLDGTDRLYAFDTQKVAYGTDLESDEEKFELWYSQDNREFRLAVEFVAGVQFAYPDEVVEFHKEGTAGIDFTVAFTAGANGTISASVDGTAISTGDYVTGGKDVDFVAVPAAGTHKVATWKIGGVTVDGNVTNNLTVSAIDANKVIAVAFTTV